MEELDDSAYISRNYPRPDVVITPNIHACERK